MHVVEKLHRIGRAERKLISVFGREPTAEEIAELTGIEPEEVESIKRSARAPISLEKPVGDGEESQFGQFIADEHAESPYDRAVEILANEALNNALANLGYRERRVIELRYGLAGEHPRHTRRGRPHVQRHPRTDPPNRNATRSRSSKPSPRLRRYATTRRPPRALPYASPDTQPRRPTQ